MTFRCPACGDEVEADTSESPVCNNWAVHPLDERRVSMEPATEQGRDSKGDSA